jgi:Fe-S cluster biogenesis protein NfuA/nitrite reductase/ring-hydroxylating ferredoxin subunit
VTAENEVAEVGARVEALLGELERLGNPVALAKAEELVTELVEFYGRALGRIVDIVADTVDVDSELVRRLTEDKVVESVLILHDLHPQSTEARVQEALDSVRPYLGSHAGGVELLGVDDDGVVRLRLEGSCEGCPSSTVTVKLAIEKAVLEACPEVSKIEVEGLVEEPAVPSSGLLQIGTPGGPGLGRDRTPNGKGSGNEHARDGWITLEGVGALLPGEKQGIHVDGVPMLICSTGGTLYAYRNVCAACGASLEEGSLRGSLLTCPSCGGSYDVRVAGRSNERPDLHLHPFPLLPEAGSWKVALGSAAY